MLDGFTAAEPSGRTEFRDFQGLDVTLSQARMEFLPSVFRSGGLEDGGDAYVLYLLVYSTAAALLIALIT